MKSIWRTAGWMGCGWMAKTLVSARWRLMDALSPPGAHQVPIRYCMQLQYCLHYSFNLLVTSSLNSWCLLGNYSCTAKRKVGGEITVTYCSETVSRLLPACVSSLGPAPNSQRNCHNQIYSGRKPPPNKLWHMHLQRKKNQFKSTTDKQTTFKILFYVFFWIIAFLSQIIYK